MTSIGMKFLFKLATFIFATFASTVMGKPWSEAIEDVRGLQVRYEEAAAIALNVPSDRSVLVDSFGQMLESIDTDQHLCAILGRRMGRADVIGHLEPPLPPLTSDGDTLALTAGSLYNWVRMAERFSEMDQPERVIRWNNMCVGSHGIPTTNFEDETTKLFFAVSGTGTHLWIYGEIISGYAARLSATLDAHPEVQTVGLASRGGSVAEAIAAGQDIRSRGLDTQLTEDCFSACPLVFMGGVNRSVFRGTAVFGFHEMAIGGEAVPMTVASYGNVWTYAIAMGVDGHAVIGAMWSAAPNDMEIVPMRTLCDMNVVTFVQGWGTCGAEQ
jgi:hypothetical protein